MLPLLILVLADLSSAAFTGENVRQIERHQVIIVGAGVSGFTAAATLLEHNVTDLIVLEASDRIGGRIHTVQYGGVTIDKGAEFVHGEKGNVVYEMVSKYDLLASYRPLLESRYFLFANTSGYIFNTSFVYPIIDLAYAIFGEEGIGNFNGSVADYFCPRLDNLLHSNNVSGQLAEAIRHHAPLLEGISSSTDNLTELGSLGFKDFWESEGDNLLKWKTSDGYKIIFDFLSKKFPNPNKELRVVDKTLFGRQVTRIERGELGVKLECADGSSYVADHVIVTMSLGMLKKHAATIFKPPLPKEKTTAIEALGFGCVNKVFMLFPTRWWTKETNNIIPLFSQQELKDFQANSTHGSWTSYTTGFNPVMNHERMLCAWFTGKACLKMESLPEEQVVDGLMELLDKLVGETFEVERPESILRTRWGSYPYTEGSYSYRTVESDKLNITNDHLAQPILDENNKPMILFAGEATNLHHYSTVHGALESGQREALNLINYLNKHTQ